MQTLSPTTELDAVNIMLGTIGESPVSSLANETSMVDVALARSILRETAIDVLTGGWHFNTEINWVLTPAADTKELLVPANCIQIDGSGPSEGVDIVQRGSRLYNRETHSYTFAGPLTVDMLILLDFTDFPQAARHYTAIRAARVFQQRMLGSETLGGFTARDESNALAALKRQDSNTADHNILTGSWSVARILAR